MSETPPGMTDTPTVSRWGVICLLLLTLVVRGGVLVLSPAPFGGNLQEADSEKIDASKTDPDGYRYLAEGLVDHGVFGYDQVPTAYRPPLYPLLLTVCVALGPWSNAAIGILHVLLGVATVWLVYRLGLSLGLGNYALLAGAMVACDPILLFQSAQVMTETAAAFLTVLSLIALKWASDSPSGWRVTAAGGCVALAVLCRATFLPWAALIVFVLPAFAQTWKDRARIVVCFAAGAAIVLGPWVARNQVQFGRPIVATTHGGFTLLLGNNPSFYEYLRSGAWGTVWKADAFNREWENKAPRRTPADELRNDRLAYAEAWKSIRREPGTFLYSCAVHIGRLWSPLPHQTDPDEGALKRSARYLVGLWYLAVLPLAVIGAHAVATQHPGNHTPTRSASEEEGSPPHSPRLRFGLVSDRDVGIQFPHCCLSAATWRKAGKTGWLWAFLLVAVFTAIHTLYWSNVRMRAPLMPVVALAAAAGMASILNRRVARARQGRQMSAQSSGDA